MSAEYEASAAKNGGRVKPAATNLFEVAEVGRSEVRHRSCAGSVGTGAGRIVLGYYGGFGVYSDTALELEYETWDAVPEDCAVGGVAPRAAGLWLLGQHRGRSLGEPPNDRKHEFLLRPWADLDRTERRVPLGPGNWKLVSNQQDGPLIVYDSTENQGVRVLDPETGVLTSLIAEGSLERIDKFDAVLIGLVAERPHTPTRMLRWQGFGARAEVLELPENDGVLWTAGIPDGRDFILGGSTRTRDSFVLARWTPGSRVLECRTEISLATIFGDDLVADRVCDAEQCGWDLSHVANLAVDGQAVLLTLGGAGSGLGACHSASAVGRTDADLLGEFSFQLLDDEEGGSAFLRLPTGAWLHDAGGIVRHLRPV